MITTGKEFTAAAKSAAEKHKTLYVLGCFGAPMNNANKKRYTENLPYNAKDGRKEKIQAASVDTFGFDCVCFLKGLLWGWNGNIEKQYGGAVYKSNGVPDLSADEMIEVCIDVSDDFSRIVEGEAVWIEGHIGLYIGDGLAVECTHRWKDGVQITAVHNIAEKAGYNGRSWTRHGKLPWVTYEVEETSWATGNTYTLELPMLRRGDWGEAVKALQVLLKGNGYDCGSVDGIFGSNTERALIRFQTDHNLMGDGIAGPLTMGAFMGVAGA